MAANPLQKLAERGQSIWLDYISRELVTTGELERLVAEDSVTGLTSNPTIFEKAIGQGSDYDRQIREILDDGVTDPNEMFLRLAISDIQHAADTLRPVWERTNGADGYVSHELPPYLSHDTPGSIETAKSFWKRIDRPNLMIKVPATPEGVPAIEELIAAGVNVNVTLIFALSAYQKVIDAYIRGLERRAERGESLDIHSVASFFVSRVDTETDKRLDAKLKADPGDATLEGLLGKGAIANARLAYELFEKSFREGTRFDALRSKGAHLQRPLWASTSAKNPNYRDVVYAEALIGPDTVDTMPPATIEAFRDHGVVEADTVRDDWEGAHRVIEELRKIGIEMEDVTEFLLQAGVKSFADSYNQLIHVIADKVDTFRGGYAKRQQFHLAASTGTIEDVLKSDVMQDVARRVWDRDPDLWKPGDAEHAAIIKDRLGWLDVIDTMRADVPRLIALARDAAEGGFRDVVLLGMGGSSLCPEVLRTSFGSAAKHPMLHVLDTTDPDAIVHLEERIDPRKTLFIAASKSGGTIETTSHLAHFWAVLENAGVAAPGAHFIAITDPGTSLAKEAEAKGFRHLFENPEDIGGRYSALSYFGLVPAALIGVDVEALLGRAAAMRASCAAATPADLNCGLALGSVMALYHSAGRDKVTILTSEAVRAFSLWAEQLIAESTGKEGRGIVPVGEEPIGDASSYGDDRLFVALHLGEDAAFDAAVGALTAAGQPVVDIRLDDLYDLGAEFFRWEFATAVAGAALHIDAFDQPNVQESKDNTNEVLAAYERERRLPVEQATVDGGAVGVYGDVTGDSPEIAVQSWLDATVKPGDYVALMAYVEPSEAHEQALQALRVAIRDRHRVATTFGFGPRFLHSTGQLHKGGPNTGVFIQVTTDHRDDADIPGKPFTFSVLEQAQAIGDLRSLRQHGRRVIRVHVTGDLAAGLEPLTKAARSAAGVR